MRAGGDRGKLEGRRVRGWREKGRDWTEGRIESMRERVIRVCANPESCSHLSSSRCASPLLLPISIFLLPESASQKTNMTSPGSRNTLDQESFGTHNCTVQMLTLIYAGQRSYAIAMPAYQPSCSLVPRPSTSLPVVPYPDLPTSFRVQCNPYPDPLTSLRVQCSPIPGPSD